MKTDLVVYLKVFGFHRFPEHEDYLANEHRHVFHIKIHLPVQDDNRELEFIQVKHWMIKLIANCFQKKQTEEGLILGIDFGHRSCEMIAKDIRNIVIDQYNREPSKIEVYEDNENGAIVYFD